MSFISRKLMAFFSSKFNQLGATINGDAAGDEFGSSISISATGDVVAVGAVGAGINGLDSGQLKIFAWNGAAWIQRGVTINGDAAGDLLGTSISISATGDVVAVSAIGTDINGSFSGQVKVFAWNGADWIQRGVAINGDEVGDQFGLSVSINATGDVFAVRKRYIFGYEPVTANPLYSTEAKVYEWNGTAWIQRGVNIRESGFSLLSVSLNAVGDKLAATIGGNVKIFSWNGTSWVQQTFISGGGVDTFGFSISLSSDGSRVAVGAPDLTSVGSGQVPFVRVYNTSNGSAVGNIIRGKASIVEYDFIGDSVSLNANGSVVAIRSSTNSSDPYKGALRIYALSGSTWIQRGSDYSNSDSVSINGAGDIFAYGSTIGSGSAFMYKFN
jgi:hypothetical protein